VHILSNHDHLTQDQHGQIVLTRICGQKRKIAGNGRLALRRCLHRWASDASIGTKDTTIARFWPQYRLAVLTGVKPQAGIAGHCFMGGMGALRAGQR